MTYTVEFSKKAERQFRALSDRIQERLKPEIDALAENPRPYDAIKLSGYEENTYRLRVGKYRLIYEIYDRLLLVFVVQIGHRREVYRRR